MIIDAIQIALFYNLHGDAANQIASTVFPNAALIGFSAPVGQPVSTAVLHAGKFQIQVQSQPGRVDFVFTAIGEGLSPSLASGVDFDTVLAQIGPMVDFGICNHAVRVAMIVNVREPAASFDIALALAKRDLTNVDFPEGCRDIDIKFNVPRQSVSVPGLEINVLVKHQTVEVQGMIFTAGPSGFTTTVTESDSWALIKQIDVNSDAKAMLDETNLSSVMSEIAAICHELSDS